MTDAFLIPMTLLCLALTMYGFYSRNMALAFAGGGAWAIFGFMCYTLSITIWDMYYSLFWLFIGLGIVCFLSAAGFRSKAKEEAEARRELIEERNEQAKADYLDRKLASIAKGTSSEVKDYGSKNDDRD